MRRAHSIRARLFLVFVLLFALVIVLGLEGLSSLSHVNDASAQIRMRWLPSTRALGDLNNFTTDFPAAEAALRRADRASERALVERQMAALDFGILGAQSAYRQIPHDAVENELYERFERSWSQYRNIVARDGLQPFGSQGPGATDSRHSTSKSAYDASSEALGQLTERNIASAREASERSEQTYGQARTRIAFTVLVAGFSVAGAMLYVTRSISAPLVDLAVRMHRLAASETSIQVFGTQRRDEIGEMARAVVVFRNNAIDLARNRHALALQAQALQERLAQEQRVTLLQRNFVSMASHEFRTPLAIIDGHAQRLVSMRDRLTAAELAERGRKMRNAVSRMTQLIDNLIGSARLIDGRIAMHFNPAPLDLTLLLRELCQQQRELAPNARIVEQLYPRPLMVHGDAAMLGQVFGNLLSNAVKYSPDNGVILVSATAQGAEILAAIEDHGIGIPESDRQRVFERYYRGSNTSGIVGTGVGLYLVRTIVALHTGSVALESNEGAGTRFEVRLPPSGAAPA
jgi:signal transduction histidine kinase